MEAIKRAFDENPDRVRATAYHQAGHAMYAILEGRGIQEIGFEWRPVNGFPDLCGGYHIPRRGRASPVAAVAGIAAARIEFANKRPVLGGEVERSLPATTGFEAPYQGISFRIPAPEDIAEATVVLLRNWASVKALAEALMERGRLLGDEVERIAVGAMRVPERRRIRSLLEDAAYDRRRP